MPEKIDWSLTTFEGVRRHQQREFRALPLREKLECLEAMDDVVDHFAVKRAAGRTRPSQRVKPGTHRGDPEQV